MPDSVARNTHSELTHVLQQFYGAPLRAVSRIVNAQNSMLRMPLDGCKYLAEVCLTLFLRLLLFLGITTPGFISREQVSLAWFSTLAPRRQMCNICDILMTLCASLSPQLFLEEPVLFHILSICSGSQVCPDSIGDQACFHQAQTSMILVVVGAPGGGGGGGVCTSTYTHCTPAIQW